MQLSSASNLQHVCAGLSRSEERGRHTSPWVVTDHHTAQAKVQLWSIHAPSSFLSLAFCIFTDNAHSSPALPRKPHAQVPSKVLTQEVSGVSILYFLDCRLLTRPCAVPAPPGSCRGSVGPGGQ